MTNAKTKKLLAGALATLMMIPTIYGMSGFSSKAASGLVYHGQVSHGLSTVGSFTVDGFLAYCLQHELATPPTGTSYTEVVNHDPNIRKTLYYGWGGPEQWAGFGGDANYGRVATSLTVSHYYNGTGIRTANRAFHDWLQIQAPAPAYGMSFSTTSAIAYQEGDYQRTPNITLHGDGRNSASFTLPAGVTLHNLNNGVTSSGTVTISGGTSFFLTAPLTLNGTWTSGNLSGNLQPKQVMEYLIQNSGLQNLGALRDAPRESFAFEGLNVKWIDQGSVEIRKTSEDGKVDGITFNILGNGVNQNVKTDGSGKARLDKLAVGTYAVTELGPNHYIPQSVHQMNVSAGQVTTVHFNNLLKKGSLKVTKSSQDGLVEGMQFHLTGTSLSGAAIDIAATTNASGVATFSNLPISGPAGYALQEINTPDRYVIPSSQRTYVNWNEVTNNSFLNILKKWRVTVNKVDYETGNAVAQGDGSLANAVYGVFKNETLLDTYSTDETGSFTTKYYVCGEDYTIREITPSEGYLIDPSIHPIGANSRDYVIELNDAPNISSREQVIKGKVQIAKIMNDGSTGIATPEEGAQFRIHLKSAGNFENARESERDVLEIDADGFAESKALPYGIYTIEQTQGWEGTELMPSFDLFIAEDGRTYSFIINNAAFESYVRIVKKDLETGQTIANAGAGFQIYDPAGIQIAMRISYPTPLMVDTFYTDHNGQLILPETLPLGRGYSIVEVQAPYGYVLDPTPVSFDITSECTDLYNGATVVIVEKYNLPQKGQVEIAKTGLIPSYGKDGRGFAFEEGVLSGAVFEIHAARDIMTPDGSLRHPKGELLETITTDENGLAKSVLLHLGEYTIRESKTPEGYANFDGERVTSLNYAGQLVDVSTTSHEVYNEIITGSMEGLKVDEEGSLLESATFGLFSADHSEFEASQAILITTSDEAGRFLFEGIPYGTWIVRELQAPDGFLLNEEAYEVQVGEQGQVIQRTFINKEVPATAGLLQEPPIELTPEHPQELLTEPSIDDVEPKLPEPEVLSSGDDPVIGQIQETASIIDNDRRIGETANPKTGDARNTYLSYLWVALAILSFAGLINVALNAKHRKSIENE